MATTTVTGRRILSSLERQLDSERNELRSRLVGHRSFGFEEREHDDEVGDANWNLSNGLLLATLERERQTLDEVELALARMKTGDYGLCAICGMKIPAARLRALPWARFCIRCAEGCSSRGSRSSD